MSSRTKIVVLRMKEIIYTAIFIGLALLLIILFLFMLRTRKTDSGQTAPSVSSTELETSYIPGVYSASVSLGKQNVNVEVTVDSDKITSVSLVTLDESIATMYPLVEPSMKQLESQILKNQSLENISYESSSRYTCQVLLNAIETALSKARETTAG